MIDLKKTFKLGAWTIEPALGSLRKGQLNQHLEPKQMTLLLFLAQHGGEVVSKEAVLAHVWPDTHVSSSGLTRNISQLRKALGDNRQEPTYILTVPKRGYQLLMQPEPVDNITPVSPVTAESPPRTNLHMSHGASPHLSHSRSGHRTPWAALIFFLLGISVAAVYFQSQQPPPDAPKIEKETLAVLPLINRSQDPDTDFFTEGLTEELIDMLGKLEHLQVVARTSSFAFRNKNLDVRTIGERLNVGKIMEGSVSRRDNQLRISVRLVDAQTGFQLWSQSYERLTSDIFHVQIDIAKLVANQMNLGPNDETLLTAGRTTNPEAYDFYLLGQYWCHKGNLRDFPTAIDFFQKAVDADPKYARAHSSLGRTWILLGQSGLIGIGNHEWMERARSAAHQALKLDGGQDEAHATLGMLAMFDTQDWQSAEESLQKAIAVNPRNPLNHLWYAQLLAGAGRVQQAIEQIQLAMGYDPLNPYILFFAGKIYLSARENTQAEQLLAKALSMVPQFGPARVVQLRLAMQQGQWQAALETALGMDPEAAFLGPHQACIYAHMGNREKAQELVGTLLSRRKAGQPISAFQLALTQVAQGNSEAAFHWLNTAYEDKDPNLMVDLATHAGLDPLRNMPRFQKFAEKVGLSLL